MIVLVSASRSMPSSQRGLIYTELQALEAEFPNEVFTLVQGGAEGGDTIARDIAYRMGWRVVTEPADWNQGGSGGRERNQLMLSKWRPRVALFFHDDPTLGQGTNDMYRRCIAADVRVKICLYPKDAP